MKKQLLALFATVLVFSSCLKQEINVIVEDEKKVVVIKKRINLFDSVVIVGKDSMGARYEKKEKIEIKADLELDKKTGEFKAKLLNAVPKYGWNLAYTLYYEDKPIGSHTYKKIMKDSVAFKILSYKEYWPNIQKKGEYKLIVEVGAYGSIVKAKPYTEVFEFKVD